MPRLRFSLLTLLLSVLLIGSSAALWWNSDPWRVSHAILEDGAVEALQFTSGDRQILTRYLEPNPGVPAHYRSVITLRDAGSGSLIHRWRGGNGFSDKLSISPLGTYVLLTAVEPTLFSDGYPSVKFCCRLSDGSTVDFQRVLPGNYERLEFSPDERFAAVYAFKRCYLFSMPDPKILKSIGGDFPAGPIFSPDGRHMLVANESALQLVSIPSVELERTFPLTQVPYESALFSPDRKHLLLCSPVDIDYTDNGKWTYKSKISLFDLAAQNPVAEFEGNVPVFSPGRKSWQNPIAEFDGRAPVFSPGGNSFFTRKVNAEGSEDRITHVRELTASKTPLEIGAWADSFSPSGDRIFTRAPVAAWDARSGSKLWESGGAESWPANSHDGAFIFVTENDRPQRIVSADSGQTLLDFTHYRWKKSLLFSAYYPVWARHSNDFVTRPARPDNATWERYTSPTEAERTILVWKKSRPEQWYGLAMLPEFWLTAFFAAALLWSIVKK